jgi:copper chaperone
MTYLQLMVPNMACAACSDAINQAIKALDHFATVQFDPKNQLVQVETSAAKATVRDVISAANCTVSAPWR